MNGAGRGSTPPKVFWCGFRQKIDKSQSLSPPQLFRSREDGIFDQPPNRRTKIVEYGCESVIVIASHAREKTSLTLWKAEQECRDSPRLAADVDNVGEGERVRCFVWFDDTSLAAGGWMDVAVPNKSCYASATRMFR